MPSADNVWGVMIYMFYGEGMGIVRPGYSNLAQIFGTQHNDL